MKSFKFNMVHLVLAAGIILLAIGAVGVWTLLEMPFGRLFNAMLYAAIAGFVLILSTLAYRALTARSFWWKVAGYPCALLAVAVVVLTAVVHIDYRIIPGTSYNMDLTDEEWTEDLKYFATEFPRLHPRLFEMIDRDEYERFVSDLERRIPELDPGEIQMELYRMLALPNDAHCFPNIFTHKLDWHSYPLQGYLFDSGFYMLDAGRDHREVIGTYLVSIDSTPIEEVYRMIRPYLSSESENNWKERFPQLCTTAEMLHAGGVTKEPDRAVFTFKTLEGNTFDVEMNAIHYLPSFYWSFMCGIDSELSYIHVPDRVDNYWFDFRDGGETLYIQFNGCVMEDVDETFDEFMARLDDAVQAEDFERCVVDVRKNGGGDPRTSRRLARYMIGNQRIDREGRLFTLISRKTFSAGVEFAALMENNSRVIIIGESTGQSPVFVGNPGPVTLPNSEIELLVARNPVFSTLIDDGLDGVYPDIPTDYTLEDYLSGKDPAMEKALGYETPERRGVELGAERTGQLTGRYEFSPFQVMIVSESGGRLRFEVTDFYDDSIMSAASELYAVSDDSFTTDIRGVTIEFHGRPGVDAEGLTIHWRGVDKRLKREKEGTVYPMEMLAGGRLVEAAEAFTAEADLYRDTFSNLENIINGIGYDLIREKDLESAVVVMKLNVDLFPASSNVYDSLGEVYMENGEVALAIENYERSLELNPNNTNAVSRLDRLRKM